MNEEELLTVAPYDTRTLLPAAVAEQGPNDRCLLRVARQNTGSVLPCHAMSPISMMRIIRALP